MLIYTYVIFYTTYTYISRYNFIFKIIENDGKCIYNVIKVTKKLNTGRYLKFKR